MSLQIKLSTRLALLALLLLCRSIAFADARDETRAKIIAHLRAFKDLPRDAWSRTRQLAVISMTQAELGDFEGARKTINSTSAEHSYVIYDALSRLPICQAAAGDLKGVLDMHGGASDPYYRSLMHAMLVAAPNARNDSIAREALASALDVIARMDDRKAKQTALVEIAATQTAIGLKQDATKTAEQLDQLVQNLDKDDPYRIYGLRDLGMIKAKLGDQTAARRYLAESLETVGIDRRLHGSIIQVIAEAMAEAGDASTAKKLALTIPDGESSDRDQALCRITLVQLRQGDRSGAEQTAQLIQQFVQYQHEAILEICELHARLGDAKRAIACARTIRRSPTRKAQTMLAIAAIMAERGDTKAAKELADGLDYPVGQFLTSGHRFKFSDPKTWGHLYESTFAFTATSYEVEKAAAADLTAAAMRCRVAILGRGDITFSEELKYWDARKVAKAQTVAGDSAGALGWVERLGPESRLEGFLGIAEGIGVRMDAKRTKSRDLRDQWPLVWPR